MSNDIIAEAPPRAAALHGLLAAFQALQAQNQRLTGHLTSRHGIDESSIQALLVVNAFGSLPLGHIGRHLGQSAGTTTFLVDRLEEGGYATRQRNPADRRSMILELTERGRAVVDETWELYRRIFERAVDPDHDVILTAAFLDIGSSMADEVAR